MNVEVVWTELDGTVVVTHVFDPHGMLWSQLVSAPLFNLIEMMPDAALISMTETSEPESVSADVVDWLNRHVPQ